MNGQTKKWFSRIAALLALVAFFLAAWRMFDKNGEDSGILNANGRVEATEIDIASKIPGRIKDIFVREGDFVTSGQTVAVIDTEALEAELRQARADLQKARNSVDIARSQLAQRESEKRAAISVARQRDAELENMKQHWDRSSKLVAEGAISKQEADDDRSRLLNAEAALASAESGIAACEAAVITARAQIKGAESAVEAAMAAVERIQTDISDSALKAPRDGRVQYRVAQPGEVVGAGGRVLNLVDLSDVYMTFFLPTKAAGRVAIGSEVRVVIDALPLYVIPAHVSFISDIAQFTPKTVETAVEREKLMFRIKAQIPVELLKRYLTQVKTGLPGMAYLRADSNAPWPEHLQVKLPK